MTIPSFEQSKVALKEKIQEKANELAALMQHYHGITHKVPTIEFNFNEYKSGSDIIINIDCQVRDNHDPLPHETDLTKMRKLAIDLLKGADLLMKKEYIIQPFLKIVLDHQEIISKYELLEDNNE